MNAKSTLFGAIAGLACVLCTASALVGGPGGVPILLLAPFPIYAAALAWGTRGAITASITAIFVSAIGISSSAAIFIGLAISIPASLIGHQANLAQTDEQGQLVWYPLSRLLFNLCLALSCSILVIGYISDFTNPTTLTQLREVVDTILVLNPPQQPLSPHEIEALTTYVYKLMPFMISSIWLIVHVTNLYLATLACRFSSLLPRPRDDIPAKATMPQAALLILALTLIAVLFFDGGLQMAATTFAGCFIAGFSLVGLAHFHRLLRNFNGGFVLLLLTYIFIGLFYFPLFIFAVGGIYRSFTSTRISPPDAGNNTP